MRDKWEWFFDKLKENIGFLRKFLQNPEQNASVRPTTNKTADMICESIQREDIKTIIELWPGTWPVTKYIVKKTNNKVKYYGIDLEQEYIDKLQKKYQWTKNMQFIHSSIAKLQEIINTNNIERIDVIISTLPYLAFVKNPEALATIKRLTDQWTIFRWISYYPPAFNKTFKTLNPKIIGHTRQNIPYVFIHWVN